MKVQLISYSQPPLQPSQTDTSFLNLQDSVAYCARVSNPSNQNNTDNNEKLIRYLIKNDHWSPLEMVSICLEIETTRDIARQILRHRSFSFQEFSQRYAVADLGFQTREARLQDTKNRQNSLELNNEEENHLNLKYEWEKKQRIVKQQVEEIYNWALLNGIAKEQARSVLPEGMTVSRMYVNGTLRSWVHYIQLRSGNGTQKEHREVALACAQTISLIFPMIHEFISL
jgi:thymidylate synthase (FAD)